MTENRTSSNTDKHLDPECPLCESIGMPFFQNRFFSCPNCGGIFRPRRDYPSEKAEISRYEEHHNDVNDRGYQRFVSPVVDRILVDFSAHHAGLDFGSGTGPVASKLLHDNDFQIVQYDPFFANHPELLRNQYDFIVCCEVIEHFHHPSQEFALLKRLLHRGGKLYCMTYLYDPSIDFANWHYQRDPTHVFIYRRETLDWIRSMFGFQSVEINGRLCVFST